MAFTPQDSTGLVAGANAYITVAEFKAYHDDRGNSYAAAPTDPDIEKAIVRASDYLDERFSFVGTRRNLRPVQTTEWPRTGAYDRDGAAVNDIPDAVKEATAEYALRAISAALNPDPDRDTSGAAVAKKAEAVGPISESVEFVGGAVFVMPKYPAADQKLRRAGLVRSGGTVLRG